MKYMTATIFTMLSITGTANADLVLDLRLDDSSRSRSVSTGSSVFVDMFLVDTDGSSPISGFGGGLVGGGGKLIASGSAAATGTFGSAGAGFSGPSFSPVAGLDTPGIASATVSATFLSSVASTAAGTGVTSLAGAMATEIHLARFNTTITGTAGDTVALTGDRLGTISGSLNNGNTSTGFPGTQLDSLAAFINSGATESVNLTISAAAVPEPSTLLVAGLIGGGVLIVRRRRKHVAET